MNGNDFAIRLRDGTVYTLLDETAEWDGPDPATVAMLNRKYRPGEFWNPPHISPGRHCADAAAAELGAEREFPPLPPLPPDVIA
jgi:hypothetical protein